MLGVKGHHSLKFITTRTGAGRRPLKWELGCVPVGTSVSQLDRRKLGICTSGFAQFPYV